MPKLNILSKAACAGWLSLSSLMLIGEPAAAETTAQTTAAAQPVTREAGIPELAALKRYARIPHFRLGGSYAVGDPERYAQGGEGGTTLESLGHAPLQLGYIATGTPRRNAAGEIINAVVVSSYYSGDAAFLYHYWYAGQPGNALAGGELIGPGRVIDTDQYYVIFVDAIGLWGSSKPSQGAGPDFPHYTLYDMVQANYRLLRDHLRVDRVLLAMGPSMGGMQSYLWPVLQPDFVEAILPIGATAGTRHDPLIRHLFQLMSAAIQSDPVWRSTRGDYYDRPKSGHPNQGVAFGWSLLGHTGTSFDLQYAQGWEAKKIQVFSWDQPELGQGLQARAADYDANDLLFRNRALFDFDASMHLGRIQAKTLIIHVANDQWIHLQNARRAAAQIPGAQLYSFDDPLAHYAIFKAPNHFAPQIRAFLQGLIQPEP